MVTIDISARPGSRDITPKDRRRCRVSLAVRTRRSGAESFVRPARLSALFGGSRASRCGPDKKRALVGALVACFAGQTLLVDVGPSDSAPLGEQAMARSGMKSPTPATRTHTTASTSGAP